MQTEGSRSINIAINDPVLAGLARATVRHGRIYNDGSMYALEIAGWESQVVFHPLCGNSLSLATEDRSQILLWRFGGTSCDYDRLAGQPAKTAAKRTAETVLDAIRAKYGDGPSGDNAKGTGYWWLAVNGPSCAASLPLPPAVQVRPVPEQLIGFPTREEQAAAQTLLLTAPMGEVERYMAETLPARIRAGEVRYVRPADPEPPTHGPTIWLSEPAVAS